MGEYYIVRSQVEVGWVVPNDPRKLNGLGDMSAISSPSSSIRKLPRGDYGRILCCQPSRAQSEKLELLWWSITPL